MYSVQNKSTGCDIQCVRITPKQATVMLKRWIWCTAKLKIFFGNLKNLSSRSFPLP